MQYAFTFEFTLRKTYKKEKRGGFKIIFKKQIFPATVNESHLMNIGCEGLLGTAASMRQWFLIK